MADVGPDPRRKLLIKEWIKKRVPMLVPIYSYVLWTFVIRPRWRRLGMGVFTEHFRNTGWGSTESVSGEGSTLEQTIAVRAALPDIVRDFDIRTMLDIPCGDFNWMKMVDLPLNYIGADIVDDVIASNQRRFANASRSFAKLDVTSDVLPAVDLILCRDCLVHFSLEHVSAALANMKASGARYLLTTTNTQLEHNKDIVTGEWRRLNLQIAPFSLPAPLRVIDEKCPNPASPDKHLALWRIADL